MTRVALVLLAALLAACGDDGAGGPDAGLPDAGGFPTAGHTPMPQALPHGHKVLANVELVTITYSTYPDKANVEAFGDAIVASTWYSTVGAEYGVHAGTHAMKVTIPGSPPASLTGNQIETILKDLIANNAVPTPPATNSQLLYMIYIPHSVTLGADLANTLGYHGAIHSNAGTEFAFGVILDDGTGLPSTTSTAAHELVEVATDPYNAPNDGYFVDPPLPDPWYLIAGEVGDLCDGEAVIMESGFAVQRIYSNAAAAAGKNPCIPADPDAEWNDVTSAPTTMPRIPAGGSAMFTLTGWSTSEIPDWTISTYDADYADLSAAAINPQLSSTKINNGKSVTLTLHAPASATSGQLGGVYVLSGAHNRPWAVGFIVQ